ncbi:hypothetical protein QQ045_032450 [Rhodiola kirilowii]
MKCQIHGHDVMSCRKIAAGNNKGTESLRRNDYDKDMSTKVMKVASATSRSTSEEDKRTKIAPRNKSKNQRRDEWVEVRRKKGSKTVQFIDTKPGDNPNNPILEQASKNVTEEAATEVVSIGQHHNIVVDQHNLGESVGIFSDDGNNENDDTLALVAFHASKNGSMQQGGVEDMSTPVHVDKIVEEDPNKGIDVGEHDYLPVVALKESQDQVVTDSGSDAEYEHHVLSLTNVGGRIYCEEFGGKSFQDLEELVNYGKENGYVLQVESSMPIEESERGHEVHEVIQNANDSGDQAEYVDPPPIPTRNRHRNKMGSRSSASSCPKKKDTNFVWS